MKPGSSQPRGRRLIPFEVQPSEGGLVQRQLTFFIRPLTSAGELDL